MDKATYEHYVKTDCWSLRRKAYLKIHNWCEVCSRFGELQIHHLSYERLGHEHDDDLLAVCDSCHRTFHGLPGTPRTWIEQVVSHMVCGEHKKNRILEMLAAKPE